MKIKRCAIYTRKSDSDGLEQTFNSLKSQRSFAENYINQRAADGWRIIDKAYDDGGYSGATLERPALKSLMEDIHAGLIDCIVTYRIDRLSRSILDFAKMQVYFKDHSVDFFSVSEHVNSEDVNNSFMLNMTMTFSQHEREVAAKRTRDKIAASKRQGLWMGGFLPLGYDLGHRKLLVNPSEADLVRQIFQRFIILQSPIRLAEELNQAGHRTKRITGRRSGRTCGGSLFTRAALYRILTNAIYIGKISHQGKLYNGMHEAIVEEAVWQSVQGIFQQKPNATVSSGKTPMLLKGIIQCQACGVSMIPMSTTRRTHRGGRVKRNSAAKTARKAATVCDMLARARPDKAGLVMPDHLSRERYSRQYRYYVCNNKLCGKGCRGTNTYLPADQLEKMVVDEVRRVLQAPEIKTQVGQLLELEGLDKDRVFDFLRDMDAAWDMLFIREQITIIRTLVRVAEIGEDQITVRIRQGGLQSLALEHGQVEWCHAADTKQLPLKPPPAVTDKLPVLPASEMA